MMHAQWVGLHASTRTEILRQIENGEATWTGNLDSEASAAVIGKARETISKYQEIKAGSEKSIAFYQRWGPYIRKGAVILFLVGSALTLIFVALATLALAHTVNPVQL
jgi:hypothetical protein